MSSRSLAVRANAPVAPKTAGIVIVVAVALLWLIELVDQLTRGSLDALGIHAWQVSSLPSVFIAPWLHVDWAHLGANTLPFAVLGFVVMIGGALRAALSTLWSVVTSGLFA